MELKLKESPKYKSIKKLGKLWCSYVKRYKKLNWNDNGVRMKIDIAVSNLVEKSFEEGKKYGKRNK